MHAKPKQTASAWSFFYSLLSVPLAGYKWSDGSAVDYTNWKANEPNNYKGSEDCAVYITSTHNWNDMNCYATTSYICAIPRGNTGSV